MFLELKKHNDEHLSILEGTRRTLEKEHERRRHLLQIHDRKMNLELDQILARIDQKISGFYGVCGPSHRESTEKLYANLQPQYLSGQEKAF